MNNVPLTEDNFLFFCAKQYDNSRYISSEEFAEDLNRIKYIKKLVTRYVENGDLKERLILNHIIVLNNCFGPEAVCRILYLKLKPQMKYIKPFLILLNVLPDKIYNVGNEEIIDTDLIEIDQLIVDKLRNL
jgi:hypothetical protein